MKAFVTGITGFVGSHLADHLLDQGDVVWGLVRRGGSLARLGDRASQIRLLEGDLQAPEDVYRALREAQPDHVYHLAARSSVADSWVDPAPTLQENMMGQFHLLEACRALEQRPGLLVVCSSDEYGHVEPGENPIRETNPFRPLSPYAVSKIAQDMLAYQYFLKWDLPVIRARAFNSTGPRRHESFVTSAFARQIALIEKGLQPPVVYVGNLDVARDFSDVRDVVRAYRLLLIHGQPGEVYNVGSGNAITIRSLLEILLQNARCSVRIEVDPARTRPSDVPLMVADCTKLQQCTGWQPRIGMEESLRDLLAYWREMAI